MQRGIVSRAVGGFFTVRDFAGVDYTCRARGALKKNSSTLLVGDLVLFVASSKSDHDVAGEGIIEKKLSRINRLQRPAVANVDQLTVVMSLKHPGCDWQLVSRLLVLAEKEGLNSVLCLNKTDLLSENELNETSSLVSLYPYKVLFTSAFSGSGINSLQAELTGKCSVLAGPSGAGKSSLLNRIQPGLFLKEGSVSSKIKRGRHTTRLVELLPLDNGGMVVDTPGFTRLDLHDIKPYELSALFPEIKPLLGQCAFRDCMHLSEPDCAVQRVINITLSPMRYEHYRYFANELNKREDFQ